MPNDCVHSCVNKQGPILNCEALRTILLDPAVVVVDKPPGIVTQGADSGANLLAAVRAQYGRVFPIHRLDRATSGLVVFARDQVVAANLATEFAAHRVEKLYIALSDRKVSKKQGRIIGDMERTRNGNWRLSRSQVNPAVTFFKSFGSQGQPRLFVMKPETGKTHQLRVAMKSLGGPIIGDGRYGGSEADRMYLHAWRLRFHLAGHEYDVTSDPRHGELFANTAFGDRLLGLGKLTEMFR